MKNNVVLAVIVSLLIVLGGLLIYKNSRKNGSNIPAPLSEGTRSLQGFNFGFSSKEITVKQGETVKIRLTSDDSPHTFTIDELGVNQFFTYGKDATITFTASQKGIFQFYCAVPGHKEGGMVGTLVVN